MMNLLFTDRRLPDLKTVILICFAWVIGFAPLFMRPGPAATQSVYLGEHNQSPKPLSRVDVITRLIEIEATGGEDRMP